MKMKYVQDLFNLFYPKTCDCCSQNLLDQEQIICIGCSIDLPLVDNNDFKSNALTQILEGRVVVENGASFLYYHPAGKVKQLIHQLKYQNNQEIGTFLGNWFGAILLERNPFKHVDYIIPVPLHQKKQKKRGYNQLTNFGKSISGILKIPYLSDVLIKTNTSNTQTGKKRLERFANLETKFRLVNTNFIQNKHLLLIDDVITTGATLEACSKELLKAGNVKISIATIALTE